MEPISAKRSSPLAIVLMIAGAVWVPVASVAGLLVSHLIVLTKATTVVAPGAAPVRKLFKQSLMEAHPGATWSVILLSALVPALFMMISGAMMNRTK